MRVVGYVLLAALGVLVLLLLAAVIRTLCMKEKTSDYTPHPDAAREREYAEKLSRMVAYETVSHPDDPELEKFRGREMLSNAESFLASSKKVGPLHVFTGVVPVDTPDNLRKIGDFLRDKDESIVAVLAAVHDGKITFHSVCGKAAVAAGVRAGDIIRSVTAICGGKGGGKPDSAMGGGSDPLKVDDALASVDDFVSEKLG